MKRLDVNYEADFGVWLVGIQVIPRPHRYYSENGVPSRKFHCTIYLYLGPLIVGIRW